MSALEVGPMIGEGGMGIVRSAIQVSLDRAVAIKTVRGGAVEGAEELVLREAWVTGYLEHPGVVPVHDIVKGDAGIPIVVMRKIVGETWEERMPNPDLSIAEGARDAFEWNIRVLMRVAEIVEFAHAKGVIHRDIKPANVMLGRFGEIYLLDWGLAVAVGEEAAQHLPRPEEADGVSGTLAYAAPEMVGIGTEPVSTATDVYLLAAVLYEIVTGKPPHAAKTPSLSLQSINQPLPNIDLSFPPRLGALCVRALQKLPSARLSDAGVFRRELVDYLRARDVERLREGAESTLGKLKEACRTNEPRARIYDLFGECRFGFREALLLSPGDKAAEHGLASAVAHLLEFELVRDARVAAALLDEWPNVDHELVTRVRQAASMEAEDRAAVTRITREQDTQTGRRTRTGVFLALGAVWTLSALFSDRFGPVTPARFALGGALQILLVAGVTFVFRELRSTVFNRRMMLAIGAALFAQTMLFLTGPLLGISLEALRTLQIGTWVMMAGALTLFVDRRFLTMALGLLVAFMVAVAYPSVRPIAAALGTIGVGLNFAYVWGANRRYRGKERRSRPRTLR